MDVFTASVRLRTTFGKRKRSEILGFVFGNPAGFKKVADFEYPIAGIAYGSGRTTWFLEIRKINKVGLRGYLNLRRTTRNKFNY